jgi:uncharacterized membrane protein
MDITTRKFTITLPTLIGILSAISTIIGGYWYFKNTLESTKSNISLANENYKKLNVEIQILREQLYDMALSYNKNVHLENEIHSNYKRGMRHFTDESDSHQTNSNKLVTKNNKIDTINLSHIKSKTNMIKLSQ